MTVKEGVVANGELELNQDVEGLTREKRKKVRNEGTILNCTTLVLLKV